MLIVSSAAKTYRGRSQSSNEKGGGSLHGNAVVIMKSNLFVSVYLRSLICLCGCGSYVSFPLADAQITNSTYSVGMVRTTDVIEQIAVGSCH